MSCSLFFIPCRFFQCVLLQCVLASVAAEIYYVTPNDSTPCPDESYECHTLSEYAAEPPGDSSNVTLLFLEGVHNLSSNFSLSNISSLTLKNAFENIIVSVSYSDDGRLLLKNIENIFISVNSMADCYGNNITRANYLAIMDVVVQSTSNISTEGAFYLLEVQDIHVIGCTFASNVATDLQSLECAVLRVINSNITIDHSVFDQNSAKSSSSNIGCVLCSQSSSITILDSIFANNSALYGGSIVSMFLIIDSDIVIQNGSFIDNQAKRGGAIYGQNSTITATETVFVNNSAGYGGVIYIAGYSGPNHVTLESCTLSGNQAEENGGAIFSQGGSNLITALDTTFSDNSADLGGVAILFDQSFLTLNSSTCSNNEARRQGGVVNCQHSSRVTALRSMFFNNSAEYGGMAFLLPNVTFSLDRCSCTSNKAANIGGIFYNQNSSIFAFETTLTNNYATYGGVAYLLQHGHITLDFCRLGENSCGGDGGAIFAEGESIIIASDTEFQHNRGLGASGNAGVLLLSDSSHAVFTNCNFTDNAANLSGAIAAFGNASLFISDCFFFNNSAMSFKEGAGGVLNADNVVITINSSIFKQNSAGTGGCVKISNSNLAIENSSIFEDNTARYGGTFTVRNNSQLNISGCSDNYWVKFVGNSAQHGGALNIIENSVAHIECTLFEQNRANVLCFNRLARSYGVNCRGGAILVRTDTNLHLVDTTFYENSVFGKGGALFSQFSSIVSSGELIVEGNSADNGTVYITSSNLTFIDNASFVNNVQSFFAHNSDIIFEKESSFLCSGGVSNNSEGGAMTAVSSNMKILGTVLIEDNQAKYGGGLKLTNNAILETFGELVFRNNFADEGGALNIYNSPIQLKGRATFEDNRATNAGGAIYAVSSSIQYYSTSQLVSFTNNTAELGGAIYFDRSSSQYIMKEKAECESEKWYCTKEWMELTFAYNSATEGGAFYVDDKGATACNDEQSESIYKECFIQTIAVYEQANDWDTEGFNYANINFVNNTAEGQGSLLYGGLLDRCTINEYAELMDVYEQDMPPSPLTYFTNLTIDSTNLSSDENIASGPIQVCFCDGDQALNCNNTLSIETKRGKPFNISIVAVNQVYTPLESNITAYISGSASNSHLGEQQSSQHSNDNCTNLEFSVFSADSVTLNLYADGPCADNHISRAEVLIELDPDCPVGFCLSNSSLECVCDPKFSKYYSECLIETDSVVRQGHFWMSGVPDGDSTEIIVHDNCPYDYCLPPTDSVSIDLSNFENGSDVQCAFNRVGLLCGSCKEGYSLTLGSSRCRKCTNYWLFLIFPFGLVGIGIVFLLMACNLTLASGTLNGLLFYANILIANKATFFPFQKVNLLTVFISWMGLNLGIPTCFFDGMDGFGKMWVQITFELYLIILMVVIVILGRFVKVANFYHHHNLQPLHTLATIAMLSYEKLSRNVFSLVALTTINYPNGTEIVWLFDPTAKYFEVKRIPLEIVALIIILMGITFNLILLFNKVLTSRCKSEYFKQFMMSFYAPLKDNHHYWVGLLLLVRNIIYFTSELLNASRTPKYSLHVIFSLVVGLLLLKFAYMGVPSVSLTRIFRQRRNIPLADQTAPIDEREDSDENNGPVAERINTHQESHAHGAVYKSPYVDFLETSFLMNLAIFTYYTLYLKDEQKSQDVLFYVSSSIVLITFIGILVYHVYAYTSLPVLLARFRRPTPEERIRLTTSGEEYGATPRRVTTHSEL